MFCFILFFPCPRTELWNSLFLQPRGFPERPCPTVSLPKSTWEAIWTISRWCYHRCPKSTSFQGLTPRYVGASVSTKRVELASLRKGCAYIVRETASPPSPKAVGTLPPVVRGGSCTPRPRQEQLVSIFLPFANLIRPDYITVAAICISLFNYLG